MKNIEGGETRDLGRTEAIWNMGVDLSEGIQKDMLPEKCAGVKLPWQVGYVVGRKRGAKIAADVAGRLIEQINNEGGEQVMERVGALQQKASLAQKELSYASTRLETLQALRPGIGNCYTPGDLSKEIKETKTKIKNLEAKIGQYNADSDELLGPRRRLIISEE